MTIEAAGWWVSGGPGASGARSASRSGLTDVVSSRQALETADDLL